MSNKNIAHTKYKRAGDDEGKPSSATAERRVASGSIYQPSYQTHSEASKNLIVSPIARHSSEEEFRRRLPGGYKHCRESQAINTEEEYFGRLQHSHSAFDKPKLKIKTQAPVVNLPNSALKETCSTSSFDRTSNPARNSPTFIRSKPRLFVRDVLKLDNFRVIQKIGEGKFGKVYMVRDTVTGFVMAMKVQEKRRILQQNLIEQFIRELKIQAFLSHPNIIDIYGFFHDQTYFYTLMELGVDGQLYRLLSQQRSMTQETTSFIVKNLLEAVSFMHSHKILHRDIKPENIILIMGNVKLCDFGWACNKIKKQELRSTFCGTPLYLSPELLRGYKYDEKVDLWAVGIMCYQLLIGRSPFQINDQQDLHKIWTEQITFPTRQKVSPEFEQFIRGILNKNPKDRLPSEQLLQLPFIRKYAELETCEQLCR